MAQTNDVITVLSDYGPLLVHRNDTHIGKTILETGYWEKDEIKFLASLIEQLYQNFEKFIIIDVGANIGTYTVALSRIFGDKASIYSFEAQRIIFQILAGNCAINSLKNVYTFNNVVSDEHLQLVKFNTHNYTNPINFGGLEIEKALNSDNVPENNVVPESAYSIQLDKLDLDLVALMKIDIEGMELRAILGAENVISKYRPVIFYEYFKTDNAKILKILSKYNYTIYKLPHANALAVRTELNLNLAFETFSD
jgi:FkbM family methyltransferase